MPDLETAEKAHKGRVRYSRKLLLHGDPDGTLWSPAMVDTVLRNHHWVWKPNTERSINQRCAEFGREIRRRFSKPVAETKGQGEEITLRLPKPATIDHVVIMERIAEGERVRAYEVEGLVPGGRWEKLCDGISIGHKRIQAIERREVAAVRLKITGSVARPLIRSLAVFDTA